MQAEEEIRGCIDQASNAAMEAVNKGSKELKDTINKSIDDLMGTSGKVDKSFVNTNVTGSLYSFQYSDYLQLFLLMALMVNQEGILLRTADVIQTNTGLAKYGAEQLTAHSSGEAKGYQLQDSYTYVEIEATIEVKPLFMKLPFVEADSPDGIKENRNWYTIKYRGVQGY